MGSPVVFSGKMPASSLTPPDCRGPYAVYANAGGRSAFADASAVKGHTDAVRRAPPKQGGVLPYLLGLWTGALIVAAWFIWRGGVP